MVALTRMQMLARMQMLTHMLTRMHMLTHMLTHMQQMLTHKRMPTGVHMLTCSHAHVHAHQRRGPSKMRRCISTETACSA